MQTTQGELKVIKLLASLVSCASPFPQEAKIGKILARQLSKRGFSVKRQKVATGRFNLFASRGKGKKAVLFYGHQDTVPVIMESEWKTNPFLLISRGNKLYGLGSYDMKGGIAAFLKAIENVNVYLKIFLAVDEENISEGAWLAVRKNKEFFKDVALAISAEPNLGLGMNHLTVARAGRCVFTITFQGKAQHISSYKKGKDAVEIMGNFLSAFYSQREKLFKSHLSAAIVRKVSGNSSGITVCDKAEIEIDVLLAPEDNIKNVQVKLEKLAKTCVSLKPRKTPYLVGYKSNVITYRKQLTQVIRKNLGKEPIFGFRPSVSDDNILAQINIPIITWGPDGGNAHSANEFVDKKSLLMLSKMYAQFLNEIRPLLD